MNEVDTLNDLLNSDLSNEKTSMPVLAATLTELTIAEAKVEQNKKQDGSNLNLVFTTTVPLQSTDGKTVNPGWKIFHTISLKPTDKYNPKENLARLLEAATGSKTGAFSAFLPSAVGCKVMAQLKPDSDPTYGDKTVIARFVPRKA